MVNRAYLMQALHVLLSSSLVGISCTPDDARPERVTLIPVYAVSANSVPTISVVAEGSGDEGTFPLSRRLAFEVSAGSQVSLSFISGDRTIARRRYGTGKHLVVIIPRKWTITEGSLSGTVVRTEPLFRGDAPVLIGQRLSLWMNYPVSVVVRQDAEQGSKCLQYSEIDSSRIGDAIRQINSANGFQVFKIADGGANGECRSLKGVEVVLVDSLQGRLATSGFESRCWYATENAPRCYPDWITSGIVRVGRKASIAEVQHELLHTLGMAHTCIVPSVMATEFPEIQLRECGRARFSLGFREPLKLERRLSEYDVLSIQLMRAAADLAADVTATSITWVIAD